jgi:beta-N-acetylhexosaminidase
MNQGFSTKSMTRRRVIQSAAVSIAIGSGSTVRADGVGSLGGDAPFLAAPALQRDLSELVRLAGQTIMVGFVGTSSADPGTSALVEQVASGLVGGVLLLGRNIESLEQTSELTGLLHAVAPSPILVAVDNEGGAVTRTNGKEGFSEWVSANEVAREISTSEAARTYYEERAAELRAAGINLNLGPVVDLNVNPASPAIGQLGRSFSSDPAIVSAFARAFVQGHRAAGVRTCLKHFPGHGSAQGDTHDGFVDITKTWTATELVPYRELIASDSVDAVMLSHLFHAKFSDEAEAPVSLSRVATDFVRLSLGFTGPIVSDDLQMDAIAFTFSDEEAATRAIDVGNDLIIFANYARPTPELGSHLNESIVRAVVDGTLPIDRLEGAALRTSPLRTGS